MAAGGLLGSLAPRRGAPPTVPPPVPTAVTVPAPTRAAEPATAPPPSPPVRPRPRSAPERGGPAIAVIIDDLGHNRAAAQPFLDARQPVALAFLPHRPQTSALAEEAHRAGKTVLLHLPMEPQDYPRVEPGPGAVLLSQPDDRIVRTLEEDLAQVPHASGVNNHMGSRASEDERAMGAVLGALGRRGLFFVDSLTSPDSVAREVARRKGVASVSRDVFLDNEQDADAIDRQAEELLDLAARRGWAVGIGHPHAETAAALGRIARLAERRGIRWIPIEEMVRRAGPGD